MPPITITNVLPGQSQVGLTPKPQDEAAGSHKTPDQTNAVSIEVPGFRDTAVREYSDWQQSQVGDESLKIKFYNARVATLAEALDLEQVHEDRDPGFLIARGIKRGIARHFVSDIVTWVNECTRNCIDG